MSQTLSNEELIEELGARAMATENAGVTYALQIAQIAILQEAQENTKSIAASYQNRIDSIRDSMEKEG